jgi:hypothetical protein
MPSNPKNTVSTVIPGPRVRILLPPAVSPLRTCPHSGRGRISTGMAARAVLVKDIKVGFSNVNEGRGYRRPLRTLPQLGES